MSQLGITSIALAAGLALAGEACGQYSAIAAPLGNAGNSYYENLGVGWGFHGPNFFFHNGGAGAAPPFGGHVPGSDAALGFGGRSNNGGFFFNLQAGQGSSQTFTSETPMIVVPNGGTGMFFDGHIRPFVTGFIPVVGGGAPAIPLGDGPRKVSPLAERLSRLRAEQALPVQAAPEAAAPQAPLAPAMPAAAAAPKDDPPLILGGR